MRNGSPSRSKGRASLIVLALMALLAAVALAACGGEDPAEAEQAIEETAVAYGSSEGEEACEFLSASALDQLGGESGCAQQFGPVGAAEFEVEEVIVDGETATAQVRNVETDTVITLEFVREDDEWKISAFPGLGDLAPATPGEEEPGSGEEPEEEQAPPADENQPPEEEEPPADENQPPEEEEPPADETP